jgi:hypothetical protein
MMIAELAEMAGEHHLASECPFVYVSSQADYHF